MSRPLSVRIGDRIGNKVNSPIGFIRESKIDFPFNLQRKGTNWAKYSLASRDFSSIRYSSRQCKYVFIEYSMTVGMDLGGEGARTVPQNNQ